MIIRIDSSNPLVAGQGCGSCGAVANVFMTNIQSEIIEKQRHISVMGLLDAQQDREGLLTLLRDLEGIVEIHITFFETKILPGIIIEALKTHLERSPNIPLKLFVLHRHLSSYLSRLGIQHRLVFEKSLAAQPQQRIKAVAIGGSAESLDKIFAIVKHLALANISVFIVQHFPKDARNILDALLRDKTAYTTLLAEDGMTIENDVIYIAPSNVHMKIQGGKIRLTNDAPVNYSRPSIDVLFESAAREYQDGLLAILLCGYGSDGSHSLKTLRQYHSRVIIEDPLDCSAQDMPKNALNTGYYDYKFPIQELVGYVSRVLRKDEIALDDLDVKNFLTLLHKQYGYDYQNYSIDSIKRRLQKAMTERSFTVFQNFADQILIDPELFEELFLEFSINVTYFFRNPEVFRAIREQVLPYLDTYAHIKIWCAGCSTGEEPYSLAILLEEYGILKKSQIYATDINPFVVAEAKNGVYNRENAAIDSRNYTESGGTKTFLDYFEEQANLLKIKSSLKEKILFFQHSLVNSGVLNEFQLILCRNVLIYFDQTLQTNTLKLFGDSLDRNGFLILGESESLTSEETRRFFKPYDPKYKIYRKQTIF